jgi:hypothetical protein
MTTLKRFVASLALSLALLLAAQPAAAASFYCWGCQYQGSFYDGNGDQWDVYNCDGCIIWNDA